MNVSVGLSEAIVASVRKAVNAISCTPRSWPYAADGIEAVMFVHSVELTHHLAQHHRCVGSHPNNGTFSTVSTRRVSSPLWSYGQKLVTA